MESSPAPAGDERADSTLRAVGGVFLAALLLHGFDHLRRGFDVITPQVFWLGNLQLALAVVAVVLVFRRHWWGPAAAIAIGLPSAVGFTAAHLLPHWSALSDPFTGSQVAPHVTALSWVAAIFEIAADLAFAWAGLAVLRMRQTRGAWPSTSSTSPTPT
ncbi:MAG: hypothetical protein QOJ09_2633 [Actinomycetota bacterium]|nr:hypothetical protein [Actinomycetota bacterium]